MQFSIITPSYKQLNWLRLAVASVADQVSGFKPAKINELADSVLTQPDFQIEHIIQDAGSPGIEDLARELGAEFFRDGTRLFGDPKNSSNSHAPYSLKIYSESDEGMYDAINRGLEKSTGGICAWLNSDEQYLEGSLARVAASFLRDPAMDVLLGDALLLDVEHKPICYRRIMVPNRWHTRLDHLHSLSCAMFFKRSALPNPPLETRWKVIGDAVLMDWFLSEKKNVRAISELLSAYAFTGQNLSANPTQHEHDYWFRELSWPPRLYRPFVVVQNRLRRLIHGAYQTFPIREGLFKFDSPGKRATVVAKVSGRWPG